MITTTEIHYDGRMQIATIFWSYLHGKPKAERIMIGRDDVTDRIGEMSRSKIKIAVHESAKQKKPPMAHTNYKGYAS